jgi:hypothetical protein
MNTPLEALRNEQTALLEAMHDIESMDLVHVGNGCRWFYSYVITKWSKVLR